MEEMMATEVLEVEAALVTVLMEVMVLIEVVAEATALVLVGAWIWWSVIEEMTAAELVELLTEVMTETEETMAVVEPP